MQWSAAFHLLAACRSLYLNIYLRTGKLLFVFSSHFSFVAVPPFLPTALLYHWALSLVLLWNRKGVAVENDGFLCSECVTSHSWKIIWKMYIFVSLSELCVVPRGPASVPCLSSTAALRAPWWGWASLCLQCTDRDCPSSALPAFSTTGDTDSGFWRCRHSFSRWLRLILQLGSGGAWDYTDFQSLGTEMLNYDSRGVLHTNTAHALTQLKIPAWCCAEKAPSCWKAKSSWIIQHF